MEIKGIFLYHLLLNVMEKQLRFLPTETSKKGNKVLQKLRHFFYNIS